MMLAIVSVLAWLAFNGFLIVRLGLAGEFVRIIRHRLRFRYRPPDREASSPH